MGSLLSKLQGIIFAHKYIVIILLVIIGGLLLTTLVASTREVKREITEIPTVYPTSYLRISPFVTSFLRASPYITPRQYNLPSVYPTLIDSGAKSSYPFEITRFTQGYKIGNTTVYLADLEKRYTLYYPSLASSRSELANWQKIADLVSADAIVLSEAVEESILQIRDTTGINPVKVNIARQHFTKKGTSYVSGEMVTVWFYNTEIPKMGIASAKQKTRSVIEELHKDVNAGRLTMKQAADKISYQYELAEIDNAYQTNAFVKFEYAKPGQKVIHDPQINEKLYTLPHGLVSEILTGRDYNSNTQTWYDAYYTFFKITEKKQAEFDTIEQLIDQRMKEGLKIIL